jgi:hypothetical protein
MQVIVFGPVAQGCSFEAGGGHGFPAARCLRHVWLLCGDKGWRSAVGLGAAGCVVTGLGLVRPQRRAGRWCGPKDRYRTAGPTLWGGPVRRAGEEHRQTTRAAPPRPRRLSRSGSIRAELIVAVGVALEVVLVLGLGLPEGADLANLGHDLGAPEVRGVGDRVLGDLALLVADIEDLGAIIGTDNSFAKVGPVGLEEELQDVPVEVRSGSKMTSTASA